MMLTVQRRVSLEGVRPTLFQITAAVVFAVALIHVFLAARIGGVAKRFPSHAGAFHLLGEVEIVFGAWAVVLYCLHAFIEGSTSAISHLENLNFREPLFVAVTMIVAGSSPILQAAT